MDLRPFVILGFVIIALLIGIVCTQSPALTQIPIASITTTEPLSPVATTTAPHMATKEEMVAFVKEAVAYARQNGKEKALVEFSNPKGLFFRGVLYIYAYDANGTTIAHPVNPEKIGVNRLNEKDAKGNMFIQDLRQAAINGTGFATYYYINPTHNNTVEKKLGYAMSVDSSWWLESGIYQESADTLIEPATGTMSVANVAITYQGK